MNAVKKSEFVVEITCENCHKRTQHEAKHRRLVCKVCGTFQPYDPKLHH